MQIPVELIGIVAGAFVALQGWTLMEVVSLKSKFAALEQQINDRRK